MQKLLLLALFVLVCFAPALAQTEKGAKMIGGNMYLTTPTQPGSNFMQFGIHPQLGFFVADKVVVGPGLSFSYSSFADSRGIGYGLMPFARYYFGGSVARLFLNGSAGLSGNRSTSPDFLYSHRITHLRLGPGLSYFLNEFVALEGVLTYNLDQYRGNPAQRTLQFNAGVQVFLPRR